MRLLLDTHAILWFCAGSSRLSRHARQAIQSSRNECWVSHATAWEVAIKVALGKLTLATNYEELFGTVALANDWKFLEPKIAHYAELLHLPFHHRDPFDRLLVAQARCEQLTIVSGDAHFAQYDVPVLW
jgi:PIN domain nuclease of toxin-antitoxin system